MANQIQIKRSNTSANATTTLLAGELAFSYNTNSIFIGAQSGVGDTNIRIGGEKYNFLDRTSPGSLTANAALVTDANSFVANIYTQGIVITPSGTGATGNNAYINSISTYSNGSYLGATSSGSNNELVTSYAIKNYVDTKVFAATTPAGANQQFQFNDSGTIAGTNNFVYDKTTGTTTVGNTSSHLHMGYISDLLATMESVANQNNYIQIVHQNSNTGPAASADIVAYNDDGTYATFIDMGINSSNWSNTQWTINDGNDGYLYTGGGNLAIGTNAALKIIKFFTGGTLAANERARITDGGLTVNGYVTIANGIIANGSVGSTGQILYSNSTGGIYWMSPGAIGTNTDAQYAWTNTQSFSNTITFGNSTVNSAISSNATTTYFTGTSYTANNSTNFGGHSVATVQGWITGNSATAYTNSTSYADTKAGAAYSNAMADSLSRNGSYTGNNTFGGTNTIINSNTTIAGVAYFNSTVGTAIIPSANGTQDLGNTTNRWGKLYLAGATIVLGNTTLSSTGDALTTDNLVVNTNATVNNIIGTTTNISSNLVITSANINATSAFLNIKDAAISGNLTISGTLTTVDTNNLQVKDSMIKLADLNTTSDILDSGFYAVSGNSTSTYFAGIYRDHGASTLTAPVFKLFSSNVEPTSIVDSTAIGYTRGTLEAYLNTGAFVSNATVVNITANSTVSSALVANSLTLTTALAASYGGTGQASYATGDILYASGSTALSKLSIPGSVANGQVLQIVNNLPAYGTLDGGTF